jgi:hypothetical protein
MLRYCSSYLKLDIESDLIFYPEFLCDSRFIFFVVIVHSWINLQLLHLFFHGFVSGIIILFF